MDNMKTGELIRNARKQKGLTQKNVAEKLGVTDRAVSKWERGICAPDISLLEPLGELLDLTIMELISGERQQEDAYLEEVERVVKETITYSSNEMNIIKKRNFSIGCLAVALSVLLSIGILWCKGVFSQIRKYSSPDESIVTTVYDCRLEYRSFPKKGGFTVDDKGMFRGRTVYPNASFQGLWWSPNSRYQVVSMEENGEIWLSLQDFERNVSSNLKAYLEMAIYGNEFFSGAQNISFDFVQWNELAPQKMLIYFNYEDKEGTCREGYMWYDYESGEVSGEMRIE